MAGVIAVSDLDGDQKTDIAVTQATDGPPRLFILENADDNTYISKVVLKSYGNEEIPKSNK